MDTLTAIAVRNIGKRLKDINATGVDVMIITGLPKDKWERLEAGEENNICLGTIQRAADYFKCSVEDLLRPGKMSYIEAFKYHFSKADTTMVKNQLCPAEVFGQGPRRVVRCSSPAECVKCWDLPAPIEYQKEE